MRSTTEEILKNRYPVPVLLTVLFLLTMPSLALANCQYEYHWLEAECGDTRSPGEIINDGIASENHYLTTPAHAGRYIENEVGPKIAIYDYTLNYDCPEHYLWGRVKYDSFEHNSFWIQLDHSDFFPWRMDGHDFQTDVWYWDKFGSITGLGQGDHKIHLHLREEQTQIDKLLITSDPHFTPHGLGDPAENKCTDTTHCPDLVIQGITYVPQQPKPGESFQIEVTIKNIGTVDAAFSLARWDLFTVEAPVISLGNHIQVVPPLAPNETYTARRTLTLQDPVCFETHAQVDWDNRILECNEDNNSYQSAQVCVEHPIPDVSVCDLCDPAINLGDLVMILSRHTTSQPPAVRRGNTAAPEALPAIVVGKEQDKLVVLTHRVAQAADYPILADARPGTGSGQGYPWQGAGIRLVAENGDKNLLTVWARDTEQYIECRGLFSVAYDPFYGFFTGSFRGDQGWTGNLYLGYAPSGISFGDYKNMRLQGLLGYHENAIYYPFISSSKHPVAHEGDAVIRTLPPVGGLADPLTYTYGLGVAECWNLDRPGFSKIVSLSNIVNPITDELVFPTPTSIPIRFHDGSGGFKSPSEPNVVLSPPMEDSETMKCVTVHLRPSVLDYTVTGSFISYVCTDCAVIRRVDWGNNYQNPANPNMSDSRYALVFADTRECYVLPQGTIYSNWSDLEGQHYRLSGFREYADPNENGFGQVIVGGLDYQRLGFLAAPVALFPCAPHVRQYSLTVSSGAGGSVVEPGEGAFSYPANTRVTLRAQPSRGYAFDRWYITVGGISWADENPTVSINLSANGTAQATFKSVSLPNLVDGGLAYRDIHPQVVNRGGTVNVSFRLQNTGSRTAADSTGHIPVRYYASRDTHISSSDIVLGNANSWSLPARQYRDITVPVPIPHHVPAGSYYIGWIIDPDNDIQESNEQDNTAYKHGKMLQVQ